MAFFFVILITNIYRETYIMVVASALAIVVCFLHQDKTKETQELPEDGDDSKGEAKETTKNIKIAE